MDGVDRTNVRITVRLEAATLGRIKFLAQRVGVDYQTYLTRIAEDGIYSRIEREEEMDEA